MANSNVNYSIVLLYAFFGKFPWYVQYFIHSCSYNQDVKFIIFSENLSVPELPANIQHIHIAEKEFKNLCERKLASKITLDPAPFKICDLRPAFGVIFSDLIKDYDFWGYGDLDVIFGNIRSFLTSEVLSNYDAVFGRHDYVTGWFSVYKNTKKMNNLFRLSKDYIKIFTTPKYYNFDEANFMFGEFNEHNHYTLIKSEIESMTHLVKKLSEEGQLKAYFEMHAVEGTPGRIRWNNGKLFYKGEFEIIAYHLRQFKENYTATKKVDLSEKNFNISTKNIYLKNA